MQLVGTLFTTIAGVQGANQQAAAAEYSAKVAEQNAQVQATDERRRSQLVMARQRALTGASGVQPVGSPLQIMLDTAKEAELQAQRTIYEGKTYGTAKRYEASVYRSQIPWMIMSGIGKGVGQIVSATSGSGSGKQSVLGSLYGQP